MAGRPNRRKPRIVDGKVVEKQPGNGVWKSFADKTPEELAADHAKALEVRRQKRDERKAIERAIELDMYRKHHKAQMERALQGKIAVFDGLLKEMSVTVKNEDGSERVEYDTSLLDHKRMKVFLGLVEQMEKIAYPDTKQASGGGDTTIVNQLIQIRNELASAD